MAYLCKKINCRTSIDTTKCIYFVTSAKTTWTMHYKVAYLLSLSLVPPALMSLYSTVVLLPLINMHKNKTLPSIQWDDLAVKDEEERSARLPSEPY